LIANLIVLRQEAVGLAQIVLRKSLHPNEQTTLLIFAPRPFFDVLINGFPST